MPLSDIRVSRIRHRDHVASLSRDRISKAERQADSVNS